MPSINKEILDLPPDFSYSIRAPGQKQYLKYPDQRYVELKKQGHINLYPQVIRKGRCPVAGTEGTFTLLRIDFPRRSETYLY